MKSRLLPVFGLVLALGLPVIAAADQSLSLRLFIATAQDDAATISRLLAAGAGADPNDKAGGTTPLHIAAKLGHVSAIDALLIGGANPNEKNDRDIFSDPPSGGDTPLHLAAQRGHHEAIESLLASGADPNVKSGDGVFPLYHASVDGHLLAVNALLAGGADPNGRIERDYTSLHAATWKLHLRIMNALLAAGADSNVTVRTYVDGARTPLDMLIDSLEKLP